MNLLSRHDLSKNGKLEYDEFKSLAKEILGEKKGFRHSLPFKVVVTALTKIVGLPLMTIALQSPALGNLIPGANLSKIPAPMLMGGIDMLASSLR